MGLGFKDLGLWGLKVERLRVRYFLNTEIPTGLLFLFVFVGGGGVPTIVRITSFLLREVLYFPTCPFTLKGPYTRSGTSLQYNATQDMNMEQQGRKEGVRRAHESPSSRPRVDFKTLC